MKGWRDLSIAKKLYLVVGILTALLAAELLSIHSAMDKFTGVRTFIGGNGSWSKAQKDAALSLQRYGVTHDEHDYQEFLELLQVNEGDHRARVELEKPDPDMNVVRDGFIAGKIHPDDIPSIVSLLRNYHWLSYVHRSVEIWIEADGLIDQVKQAGTEYHQALTSHPPDTKKANEDWTRIDALNKKLTILEISFATVLGESARWLERTLFWFLFTGRLVVASIVVALALTTSRRISGGLAELNEAARKIGQGNFGQTFRISSKDEIGTLMNSIEETGRMLQSSYTELEERVAERTRELNLALQSRDEFLSIASHELKTPLTSLFLELEIVARKLKQDHTMENREKIVENITLATQQGKRIANLVDELLDLTRIRAGKLDLHRRHCDLRAVILESIAALKKMAERLGSTISVHGDHQILGEFDPARMSQVVTNLVSNAIKYGEGKPIEVTVSSNKTHVQLRIQDQGRGIPADKHRKIFERFERAVDGVEISGLGLGLYITRQIVVAHGGSISVQSAPGQGALFTVVLPVEA